MGGARPLARRVPQDLLATCEGVAPGAGASESGPRPDAIHAHVQVHLGRKPATDPEPVAQREDDGSSRAGTADLKGEARMGELSAKSQAHLAVVVDAGEQAAFIRARTIDAEGGFRAGSRASEELAFHTHRLARAGNPELL